MTWVYPRIWVLLKMQSQFEQLAFLFIFLPGMADHTLKILIQRQKKDFIRDLAEILKPRFAAYTVGFSTSSLIQDAECLYFVTTDPAHRSLFIKALRKHRLILRWL